METFEGGGLLEKVRLCERGNWLVAVVEDTLVVSEYHLHKAGLLSDPQRSRNEEPWLMFIVPREEQGAV